MLCDLFLRCRVLCDAAILDAGEMKWSAVEPTPFSRCAHSGVLMARQSSPATGEACAACQARPAARGTAPYLVLSLTWLALLVTCSAGTFLALTGFAHHIWHQFIPCTQLICPSHMALPHTCNDAEDEDVGGSEHSGSSVIIYGGFSGEAVEGDVLQIDAKVG